MKETSQWWWENSGNLAHKFRKIFPEEARKIIKKAEQIANRTFCFQEKWEMEQSGESVHFTGDIAWDIAPHGDPEWIFAMNRHTSFLILGQAYLLTGDKRWYDVFEALLRDWIARVPLTPGSTRTTWRTIEAGIRCENWLKAYCCFRGDGLFSEEILSIFGASLRTHAEYLYSIDDDFRVLSNWGVLQNHGLFLLGVFLQEPRYTEEALNRLQQELSVQILPDGVQWEQSPMYHCEVLRCCLDVVNIAKRNHMILPKGFAGIVHQMTRTLAVWCKPNGRLPCQSDSDEIDARDIFVQGAVLFRDSVLKHWAGQNLFPENLWELGEFSEIYDTIPAQTPLPLSAALPQSGNYILRSSAGPKSQYLRFHCGCMGSGHGHADLLHFDLYSGEEDILIDSGRYTYVDGPDRTRLKQPASHNTVRIDGFDFSTVKNSWDYSSIAMPVKGEYRFGKIAEFVSGGHLGYMELPNGPVFVSRKIVWIKPDIFVVCDSFYGGGSHSYEQYFHFSGKGHVAVSPGSATYSGQNTTAKFFFLSPGIHTEQQESTYSTTYNQMKKNACLRNTWQASGFTSLITVVCTSGSREGNDSKVEELPVYLTKTGDRLKTEQAQAIKISQEDREAVVLFCHREMIAEVGFLCAGDYKGYGKTIVFTPELPYGECLQW